jgi:hypothetical protein
MHAFMKIKPIKTKKRKVIAVQARLPWEIYERVEKARASHDVSWQFLIEELLSQFVEQFESVQSVQNDLAARPGPL